MKDKEDILKDRVPRKIIGLLLKKEMCASDLAREIHNNPNNRSGICPYLDKFETFGWIERRDLGKVTGRKKVYKAKPEVLGDFDKKEYAFIQLVIERFWVPLQESLIDSLKDLLLGALVVQKVYKITGKIDHYNPKKDLKFYKENKKKFWKDTNFRDRFLNKIRFKGEDKTYVRESFHLVDDFKFVSLLAPSTLFNKIDGRHHNRSNPLYILFNTLNK